jgi:uncharacterized repeat protein (TIGR03803 family)
MACPVFLFCVATAIASLATTTLTTLANFDDTNGAYPFAELVQATNGNFYGTTAEGGDHDYGTVFKITPAGTLTTLHRFDDTDGAHPYAGLVLATDGDFYGTTFSGGANLSDCNGDGCGTVFKITPGGTLTTLYSFGNTDGANPFGGLVQATNGDFYGTTENGGANTYGTVFKITPGGTLTTLYTLLYTFGNTDGANPFGGLVQATNGDFYGTTLGGAGYCDDNGCGTVFKITPAGTLTTLYSFCSQLNCTDGYSPFGLVQATNGNFYGTTMEGGANESGTVFKITPAGTLTTLHSFDGTDGSNPEAGLVQATNGDFYGTTANGGANNGTVFKMTPAGTLTTLHSFCSTNCGVHPSAGLVQATNGYFYGTTEEGGVKANLGTVFSLSVGLGPFVKTLPTSGKAGAAVIILGNDLTGSTAVSFNGTAATFTVVSSTEIKATVPTGATTGTVEVTTPSRTLNSNVAFRVTP